MKQFNFSRWNTITGWCIFFTAFLVYCLTVEPSLSFWDSGEYIAASAKLQIAHPPGAPLFQMLGAVFATFASSPQEIAFTINMVSVLASAFTILFMFWSLTMLITDLIDKKELNPNNQIMILGSSLVGSLAFLFSDSFWFNATETEVYALASFFIAILLWSGLRWGREMHNPNGHKWLLLIAFLTGLSFGVHFMALLTIPSLGLIYYFKNYNRITIKNFIVANVAIVALLFLVFGFLMPYTLALFAKTEIFMVNSMGLPFNSGTIFMFIALAAGFYFGLRYTHRKNLPLYNTGLLCILFLMIGFSSWLILPIRANAQVVLNQNNPENAAEVLAYYNREQYPEQKTFYGPMYTQAYAGLDQEQPYVDEKPNYERNYKTGRYEIVNNYTNARQNLDNSHKGFLPRLSKEDSAVNYMAFAGPPKFSIDPQYDFSQDLAQSGIDVSSLSGEEAVLAIAQARGQLEQVIGEFRAAYTKGEIGNREYDKFLRSYGRYLIVEKPTLAQNISFMFNYQFGYMYLRYLMWNFAGRQSDEQGKYDNVNGNWMSGIDFIDQARLGPQTHLTQDMLNNKGRNIYYMLPFALGIIGLLYHAQKKPKTFYILLALFLFTGIALKIFLNEKPFEVRERDYAMAGSYYVFAMWIAFGAYALYRLAVRYFKPVIAIPAIMGLALFAGPVKMATENWDDHDRSGRYTAVAMAKAYLDSCDPNAILFTVGDNDTFPLWYAQEVEGYRTDVRIVCTTLLHADWYIDMLKRKAYESDPMPVSFSHEQYASGNRDFLVYNPMTDQRIDINDFMKFVHMDDERTKIQLDNGHWANIYPTNKVRIGVDKEKVIKNQVVDRSRYDTIVSHIDIDLPENAIYKGQLIMLDIIRNNNWDRPVYFAGRTYNDEDYAWMKDYLQLQGMALKLVPVKTPQPEDGNILDLGYVDTQKSYDTVKKWEWGNSGNPQIYHDPQTRHNGIAFRNNLARLMDALIKEKKTGQAKEIIDIAMEKMPVEYFGYYAFSEPFADGYYRVAEKQKARKLLTQLMARYQDSLRYYKSLPVAMQDEEYMDIVGDIERYRNLLIVMQENNDHEFYSQSKEAFNKCNRWFSRFGRSEEI